MSRKVLPTVMFAASAAAALLLSTTMARAAEPSQQEVQEQIHQLQEKIAQLEAKQAEVTKKADTAPVDKAIANVVRDSEQRSQLLAPEGFTAGYSNGKFLIQSEDGNFVLNPSVQFDFRYAADYRQNSKNGKEQGDDAQAGFEARRLKFALAGNIFSKDVTYEFRWGTSRSNGTLVLEEGWARYHFDGTPFSVRAGTFLNAWDHETGVSSKRQLAVERSVLHELFASAALSSENYTQGVEVSYDDGGALRGWINYNDGLNSRNTNFQDSAGAPALGLVTEDGAVSGRVEYKLTGDWKSYDKFTALNTKKDLLVIGGGFDIEAADNVTAYLHTADVQWEPAAIKGLAFYGAYVGLYRDFRTVGSGINGTPYDWGILVQGSYLLDSQWEVFGRYDFTGLDDSAPAGSGTLGAAARIQDQIHEITVGVNYYIKGHAAKLTVDGTYLPNGSPIDLNGANILAQPNDKAQFLLRAQFQLLL